MTDISATVAISRPPDVVFAYALDPTHWPKWQSRFEEAEETSTGPTGIGTTYRTLTIMLGRPIVSLSQVTAFERDHLLVIEGRSDLATFTTRWTYEPTPTGTQVTIAMSAEVRPGLARSVASVLEPWLQRSFVARLQADLESLKLLVEAPNARP